jgi:hypothetical protein
MSDYQLEALEGRVLLSATVTFAPPVIYPSGQPAHNLAFGDFTGNGLPSIAVTDPENNTVTILLNQGNGNFVPGTPISIQDPLQVAAGNFLGNGKTDLVVVTDILPKRAPNLAGGAKTVDGLVLFVGNGNGTFTRAATYRVIQGNRRIVVGDFNGDGLDDIALSTPHAVGVLINTGDGTFAPEVRYHVTKDAISCMALGDFNGDGIPDIVVGLPGQMGVRVLLGNGNGTFAVRRTSQLGVAPVALAVGDFNNDGKQDVAAVSGNFRQGVFIRLGNGNGTFSKVPLLTGAGAFLESITAADFSGDGDDDLAVVDFTSTIRLSVGNGDGTFDTSTPIPGAGQTAFAIYSEALTNDGKTDLVVLRNGNVYIYLNTTQSPI